MRILFAGPEWSERGESVGIMTYYDVFVKW